MPQLQVTHKTLKLTNVLIANINADDGDDLAFCNKIDLYIKSKGHQPMGPLIQYTGAEKTESGELDLIVRFLRQVNGYIKHTEPPYTMQPVFRVPNCLYVRFIGPQNKLNIAYQKLAVFAYEEEIELTGNTYTVYVNQLENEDIVADIFMERTHD